MINPHHLVDKSTIKNIKISNMISKLYFIWKILLKKNDIDNISEFDAFATGYFLGTNSVLKGKYLESYKIEEKCDNRIQNTLWK